MHTDNTPSTLDSTNLSNDLDRAAQESLASGILTPLLDWARSQGEDAAHTDDALQSVIERALHAANTLQNTLKDLDGATSLAATLATAAAEGYIEASQSATHDPSNGANLQDRLAELTALHRINSAANSSLKLADMLHETAQAVVEVTQADVCTIFLYEPEWDQLVLEATSAHSQEAVGKVHLRLGEGITGWAAMLGKPVAVTDAWDDSRFKYIPSLQEDRTVSMLAALRMCGL